MLNIQRVT